MPKPIVTNSDNKDLKKFAKRAAKQAARTAKKLAKKAAKEQVVTELHKIRPMLISAHTAIGRTLDNCGKNASVKQRDRMKMASKALTKLVALTVPRAEKKSGKKRA